MVRRTVLAAAMLIAASVQAPAQQTAIGLGNVSCGTWSSERAAETFPKTFLLAGMEFWALGFLSGANEDDEKDFLAGTGTDAQALFAWLDNFCRSHPLEMFPTGVGALRDELRTRARRSER